MLQTTNSSTCNYTHLRATSLQTFHRVPRFMPPTVLYPLPNTTTSFPTAHNNQFNLFNEDYFIVLFYSAAVYTVGTYLLLCFLLGLVGCGSTCCTSTQPRRNNRNYRNKKALRRGIHTLLLVCCGAASFLPLLSSQRFGTGVGNILSSFETMYTTFSNVDSGLVSLNTDIGLADHEINAVIQNNPCHSAYSETLLHSTQDHLDTTTELVRDIVTVLTPLNGSMTKLHANVVHYSQWGEHIRWYAILGPLGCTLVYVLLEMMASISPMARHCPCCLCRTLARLVGWGTLTVLMASLFVYGTIGMVTSDYCAQPDRSLSRSLALYEQQDALNVNIGQWFAFYTTCASSSSSSSGATVAAFQQYLAQVDQSFVELKEGMGLWNLACPQTTNVKHFQTHCNNAQGIYERDVSPFRQCHSIQPQYCTFVNDGVCGALVEGAGGVVVTQGICVLCLFVSLVLSCVCSARRTEQGAGPKAGRERRPSNDRGSLSFRPVPVEEDEYCYNRENHNHYNHHNHHNNVHHLEDPLLGPSEGGSQGGSSFVVPVKQSRFQSVQAFIGEEE